MKKLLKSVIVVMAFIPSLLFAKMEVVDPTIVTTTKPGELSAIHLLLKNTGDETVNLVMLETPAKARLELHGMTNGKMTEVSEIPVPAKGSTTLRYGGLHIMVYDLQKPLSKGQTFPVTLFFDNGDIISVKAKAILPTEVKR